jgi:hypothetical protein
VPADDLKTCLSSMIDQCSEMRARSQWLTENTKDAFALGVAAHLRENVRNMDKLTLQLAQELSGLGVLPKIWENRTMDKLIGRIVKRNDAFFEIKEILPPMPDHKELGQMLRLMDMDTGEETTCHFLGSIRDGDLSLVPTTFPRDRLDKLRAFYRLRNEAHDIEMDLLTWDAETAPTN